MKAAGAQVGYAFHLQNPWFLVGLSAVTFVFSLNLLGVFEVILPGSITNAAGEAAGRREGYAGAFFQGVLATVLGSACTAPFFGPALGFAFSQSGPVIFAMFAAIAAGMSAPFVLLAAQPRMAAIFAQAGRVDGTRQAGHGLPDAGDRAVAAVDLRRGIAVAGRGRLGGRAAAGARRGVLGAGGVQYPRRQRPCALGGAGGDRAAGARRRVVLRGPDRAGASRRSSDARQAVSPTQLDDAQKTGRPVFVDFTARLVRDLQESTRNAVLETEPSRRRSGTVTPCSSKRTDTAYSEDITKLLQQFNAPSVPLYVIYPAGQAGRAGGPAES